MQSITLNERLFSNSLPQCLMSEQSTNNSQTTSQIAIVIPAFKPDYLAATLESIARQQNQNFQVYIGDDASPSDLRSICQPYLDRFSWNYVRFPSNLGSSSLVSHWNRCVKLTSEPWVWLFSDDDLMEPECVGRLVRAIGEEGKSFDLFHFNVIKIDSVGKIIRHETEFPAILTWLEFAQARLRFELSSYAPDYVFSREAFDLVDGFVDFPLAWCSDDATWISMASNRGIRTLDGPKVQWRFSDVNISSSKLAVVSRKIDAMICFLLWLDRHCRSPVAKVDKQSIRKLMTNTPSWLFRRRIFLDVNFWPKHALQVAWRLRSLPDHGFFRDLLRTALFDVRRIWRKWRMRKQ